MTIRSYRDLIVWRKGIKFAIDIYRATGAFPKHERFGLSSQLQRAAVSIPSNIAEGHIQQSNRVLARHLDIALGSAAEVDTQLLIAQQIGYLTEAEMSQLREQATELMKMLHGLRKSVQSLSNSPDTQNVESSDEPDLSINH